MIFDTHSHYDDEAFDTDRDLLLTGLTSKGVGTVVSVGADIKTSQAALELAKSYENVYAALGVHPSETGGLSENDMEWLYEHVHDSKVVAVGEIGLDYYWNEPEAAVQKVWFERQIALAKEKGMPVIYHSREAAEDTMEIIRRTKAYECGGVIHCYSYSADLAKQYVEMGFYIGVGGVVTFKNGRKLKETVKAIPLERIVLETDCPYLSPEPNRGKRNDSSNLIYVAQQIAELKQEDVETIIQITESNARKLYGLEKVSC